MSAEVIPWDKARDIRERALAYRERKLAVEAPVRGDLTMQPADMLEPGKRYPRYASGISPIDLQGGLCGLTAIGAEPGLGKSQLVLGASLENAHNGWCVVYLDADNDKELVQRRIGAYYGPDDTSFSEIVNSCWFWVQIDSGHRLSQAQRLVSELSTHDHVAVLVVADTFQALCRELTPAGGKVLDTASDLSRWMKQTTRRSSGQVAFIAISELNKQGEMWGRQIVSDANCIIHIDPTEGPGDEVEIRTGKIRDGKGRYSTGKWVLDWSSCRFVRP